MSWLASWFTSVCTALRRARWYGLTRNTNCCASLFAASATFVLHGPLTITATSGVKLTLAFGWPTGCVEIADLSWPGRRPTLPATNLMTTSCLRSVPAALGLVPSDAAIGEFVDVYG